MKRVITILMLFFISIAGFGQLNPTTIEEYAGFKTVCKISCYGWLGGEIRYLNNIGYVLCGTTDNKFEKTMASIFLGETKENAIQTIHDLENLRRTADIKQIYVVKGVNNFGVDNTTKLYVRRVLGARMLMMETDNVAGISNTADYVAFSKNKFIEAIRNFKE